MLLTKVETGNRAPQPTKVVARSPIPLPMSIKLPRVPGAVFGETPVPGRKLDEGMGVAVARRTVFRPEDQEDFGRVADRVAAGNMSLLGKRDRNTILEQARLRNAIATGALITSGRHLQHGDATQASRSIEAFTNCASSQTSFASFYLLLNGAGVGRAYDDELQCLDWGNAPKLKIYLSPKHKDYPHKASEKHRIAVDLGWVPEAIDTFIGGEDEGIADRWNKSVLSSLDNLPKDAVVFKVPDSREGWAKSIEILEAMAFAKSSGKTLVLDCSDVRPYGAPIAGMQGRPASGPISLIRGLINIRDTVIEPSRNRNKETMPTWEQAMRVDHALSVEVQCGGARRAARMATKSWRDPGVLRFTKLKTEAGLWTANHSVMVDAEFWDRVGVDTKTERVPTKIYAANDPMTNHAKNLFAEITRCAYVNGEPGIINGDMLEDHKTGKAWDKPVYEDGRDFRGVKYQADHSKGLLAEIARKAQTSRFPMTTNPCGEIALHVTGGYCVIADFAPVLACPVPIDDIVHGDPFALEDVCAEWDARVEASVRLGVRFLIRANSMDALYGTEVARTNRIGIGPTGLHEYAWVRFGLTFRDMLNPDKSGEFWRHMDHLSTAAKNEADIYSDELGMNRPMTVTTVKPAGTTSKLFGITEGVHLPARAQYLRWVQFRGQRDEFGEWEAGSDVLLAEHQANGYPIRKLKTFQGMSAVGFPTRPMIARLGMGDDLVTASQATPTEQYEWLKLVERNWIGKDHGNQISYTLKVYTDQHEMADFKNLVLAQQPLVKCCSIMPTKPDHELGYEYLPEQAVSEDEFDDIVSRIRGHNDAEAVDMVHLQCAGGVCPL